MGKWLQMGFLKARSWMLFFICINDLPKITDNDTKVVLFADDTSITVTNFNQGGFQTALNKTLSDTISWFKANFQSLNFNKMYYLEFRTKNCIDTTLDINYFNKSIANVTYTMRWEDDYYESTFPGD